MSERILPAFNKMWGVGEVLFNSMFTQALLVGITVPELTHGTTIANLGFEEVRATRWHSVVCSRVFSYPSKSMLENVLRTLSHAEKNVTGDTMLPFECLFV